MKLKERLVNDIDSLNYNDLLSLGEIIDNYKKNNSKIEKTKSTLSYLKVREALKHCKIPMSDDIIQNRDDRI